MVLAGIPRNKTLHGSVPTCHKDPRQEHVLMLIIIIIIIIIIVIIITRSNRSLGECVRYVC